MDCMVPKKTHKTLNILTQCCSKAALLLHSQGPSPLATSSTFAHELGHNIGMQ